MLGHERCSQRGISPKTAWHLAKRKYRHRTQWAVIVRRPHKNHTPQIQKDQSKTLQLKKSYLHNSLCMCHKVTKGIFLVWNRSLAKATNRARSRKAGHREEVKHEQKPLAYLHKIWAHRQPDDHRSRRTRVKHYSWRKATYTIHYVCATK